MSTYSFKPGWKFGGFVQNIAVRVDPAHAETNI